MSPFQQNGATGAVPIILSRHCSVTSVALNSHRNWKVEYECPQCGAPADLDETTLFFRCPFCKTKLIFAPSDYFRYYLAPLRDLKGELYYLPYWRIRGTLFSCHGTEVQNRLLDATICACDGFNGAESLGLKPRTMALRFVHPAVEGRFVDPVLPLSGAIERMEERFARAGVPLRGEGTLYETFLGERVSLIFSPVFLDRGRFCDGVTGEVGTESTGPLWSSAGKEEKGKMTIMAALCPECGWELSGESDSTVLLCRRCRKGWQTEGKDLAPVTVLTGGKREGEPLYLPFWMFRGNVTPAGIGSYGDLARFANLPRVVPREWDERPLSLWFPAFRVRADLLVRLGKLVTLRTETNEFVDDLPERGLYPVTLPRHEAAESLKIVIAELAGVKKRFFPLLAQTEVVILSCNLVMLPFREQGDELVGGDSMISIPKNAILYGRNL